jgi:hypothetical protein
MFLGLPDPLDRVVSQCHGSTTLPSYIDFDLFPSLFNLFFVKVRKSIIAIKFVLVSFQLDIARELLAQKAGLVAAKVPLTVQTLVFDALLVPVKPDADWIIFVSGSGLLNTIIRIRVRNFNVLKSLDVFFEAGKFLFF